MRRKKQKMLLFILACSIVFFSIGGVASADLPVVDFVNAALNELRNSLMQDQFTQQIVVFFDQLSELQKTYQEIIRFNSGIEEFVRSFVDSATKAFNSSQSSFRETFLSGFTPSPEQAAIRNLGSVLEGQGDSSAIKSYMEVINGADPQSTETPYITFEESQVGEAYLMAHEIRKRSDDAKKIGENIQDEAVSASPKGAQRLTADALGKMIVFSQENQEVLAKLLELEATSLEQTSRDEKRFERARIEYMDEMKAGIETLGRPA